MKIKNIFVLISFFMFAFHSNTYAFSFMFSAHYIPIDSLTQKACLHYVGLDLKAGKINLFFDNQEMIFEQRFFNLDTIKKFYHQRLFYKLENGNSYELQINELKSIGDDSIYISVVLHKFNNKNVNVNVNVNVKKGKNQKYSNCKVGIVGYYDFGTYSKAS